MCLVATVTVTVYYIRITSKHIHLKRKIFYVRDRDEKLIAQLAKKYKTSQSAILRAMLTLIPFEGDTLKRSIKSKL